jgi:hypothetical protein
MSDIDQLEGLELTKAFAEALGYQARILKNTVEVKVNQSFQIWDELPTYLIISCFDRIKPDVGWYKPLGEIVPVCRLSDGISQHAEGSDFKTAMARLVVKLDEEKK